MDDITYIIYVQYYIHLVNLCVYLSREFSKELLYAVVRLGSPISKRWVGSSDGS